MEYSQKLLSTQSSQFENTISHAIVQQPFSWSDWQRIRNAMEAHGILWKVKTCPRILMSIRCTRTVSEDRISFSYFMIKSPKCTLLSQHMHIIDPSNMVATIKDKNETINQIENGGWIFGTIITSVPRNQDINLKEALFFVFFINFFSLILFALFFS